MTRDDYIRQCQERDRAYLDAGDWKRARDSMLSDMHNMPKQLNDNEFGQNITWMLSEMCKNIDTTHQFIEGFSP